MNDIANNIKELRKKKGLSQEQLAELLHVTRQTVSAWERGVAQPSLDTLGEIAGALEAEPEALLYSRQSGRQKLAYRAVSFWPVVGITLLYWMIVPITSEILFSFSKTSFGTREDEVLLFGQIFLAMLITFCYCALKDLIRNREYYEQEDEEEK